MQMQEQMKMEPTMENYDYYLLNLVYEYEYWKQVIANIIWNSNW